MNTKLVDELQRYFDKNDNVSMAFLFGSHAKNRALHDSDIDIAVCLKNNNKRYFDKIWNDIERLVPAHVDLINLKQTYATLAFEAIKGIKLKIEQEDKYIEFMLKISQEAVDFQEFIIDLWNLKKRWGNA